MEGEGRWCRKESREEWRAWKRVRKERERSKIMKRGKAADGDRKRSICRKGGRN